MIRIVRGPVPPLLSGEKVTAAKEKLQRSFHNAERQERFRFEVSLLGEVKNDLMQMCNHKCAYCESKLGVVSMGDVENFRPKSGARNLNKEDYAPMHYWWLAYEWDNLLITCQICNQKYKRDYFPVELESARAPIGATGADLVAENALLIDPCAENPDEHLKFNEDGNVEELTKKGKVTIELLGLNRSELVNGRKQAATMLLNRLDMLGLTGKSNTRIANELVKDVNDLFSDHPVQEYVATQRCVFETWVETNKALWERIMDSQNTSINISSSEKKSIGLEEASEIKEVAQQLSNIKRFSIKKIEIENFKSIETLTLNMLPVNETNNREGWLLLLGDNGIGKSSILQAIALTLAGGKQLKKLGLDVLDFLRRGTEHGFVRIHSCEHDNPVELRFDTKGFYTSLDEAPTFVLAYGSTRLMPKGNIVPDTNKEPYLNIRNLFDYSVALNNPNDWLCHIDETEFKERVAPVFFDVLALRDDDKLLINEGKIHIKQFGEKYELEDNSDGYKTIVSLVADIMQTLSVDRANYHNSQGLVMIDEIGNHLHPRWRLKIAGALRKAFPKLQFIVTTHEPLCLRGLSHGEVVVLVRDQQNIIRALDSKILPDHSKMRIEQLLTSDLFGLIDVMDENTQKTYEEYYQLLSKQEQDKSIEDKSRISEMSAELLGKQVLGNTTSEQALYEVINETFAKKIREEGFKTKEELKQETVEEVKNLVVNKKINWL